MPRFLNNAALLLVLAPGLAHAQQDAQRAAEQVVRQALAAHDSMQWSQLVRLIHPRALADMHQSNLASITAMARAQPQARRRDPNLPECVAEWFERQASAAAENPFGLRMLGVSTVEEATRLSAEEFMARWLEGHDQRAMARRVAALRRAELPDSVRRQYERVPPIAALRDLRTVIGSVVENDSTAVVLHRPVVPVGAPAGEASVMTVRLSPAGWRLWPSGWELFPTGGWTGYAPLSAMPPDQKTVQDQAGRTITWDATNVPAGRASLSGFGDSADPQALVIEVGGERLRIPRSAFEALADLLEIRHYAPRR
ncbi:MAG TPA: hypothetical protein VK864_16935 [Longimicrobiales bacterium]|nr:hypothetical protein [Longimicrobiales bacterium]